MRFGSYGPAAVVSPGPTTLVTSPATEEYIIQTIWVSNPTAAAISFTLSIGADGAGTRIIGTNTAANMPANTAQPFYGPFRVPASTVVTASAGASGLVLTFVYARMPV
jgi:hypothetical protein